MTASFRPSLRVLQLTCAAALTIGLAGTGVPAFAGDASVSQSAIEAAPEASAITFSPGSGGVAASTVVTLKGDGVTRATEVRFGTQSGKLLPGAPAGEVRVQAPTAASINYQAKKVPVVVVIDGTAQTLGDYAYVGHRQADELRADVLDGLQLQAVLQLQSDRW
jgi:hypothetical protein